MKTKMVFYPHIDLVVTVQSAPYRYRYRGESNGILCARTTAERMKTTRRMMRIRKTRRDEDDEADDENEADDGDWKDEDEDER